MFEPAFSLGGEVSAAITNILLDLLLLRSLFEFVGFHFLGSLGIAAAHDILWPFRFWEEGAGDGVVARNVWIHRFPH